MMMGSGPNSCKRTNRKKWRCSRNVVPDQKYSERHMHRGFNHSRNNVETS
ncbi:putative WRC domain, growth-regulating factor [Lupinus albus]|uniref:Growth-regulating factor n=1 Tax=Lupinus albus TaxID=3870 RepID=A0A6A4PIW4_LUPAL|nr:putative WRC domain, growth-regulating factor [Lupinus albus]